MSWSKVGNWIKGNAGTGASLVGSLLTGNVPGAVAAGVAIVSSATGVDNPSEAMVRLQSDPDAMLKLRQLYFENEESIRGHIQRMTELRLNDYQAQHSQTQSTVRSGDNAEDVFVRRTRPAQSWLSLISAIVYIFYIGEPDIMILGALLTLPWAYAGLRQVGKGIETIAEIKTKKG